MRMSSFAGNIISNRDKHASKMSARFIVTEHTSPDAMNHAPMHTRTTKFLETCLFCQFLRNEVVWRNKGVSHFELVQLDFKFTIVFAFLNLGCSHPSVCIVREIFEFFHFESDFGAEVGGEGVLFRNFILELPSMYLFFFQVFHDS